jgi:CO/xanthine dehydrogenase FAD-binding subunit
MVVCSLHAIEESTMLPEFDLIRPQTIPEALAILAEQGADAMPVAGGTNVVVDLRAGKHQPRALIDIARLPGLRGIHRENGHLVMGGGTTISDLLYDPLIAQHATALREAAAVFANPLIRNRATVGGNLADASPAADTAPPLLALDAEVELASQGGIRRLPLADFLVGVRVTLRQTDELLTAVRFPVPPISGSASHFQKVGLRKADAISVLSAAVAVAWDTAGCCTAARIALGALAPRPLRVAAAETLLVGEKLTHAVIAEAARLAGEAARPIDDIRGSAGYRRKVTEVVVLRLLDKVLITEASA